MPRRLSLIPILLAALAFALLPLEGRPAEPDDGTVILVAKRGLWYVLDAKTDLLLKKQTDGLWEELVGRSERKANTI